MTQTSVTTRPKAKINAATRPLRVAVIGIGWWSDVLADAALRSGRIEIASCFTRSADKRAAFAEKYRCRPVADYAEILADNSPSKRSSTRRRTAAHLETTRLAASAGKHVFLDKPIANTVTEGREIARVCDDAGVVLALGYQRRRESHFRWIKSEIEAGRFGRLLQAECEYQPRPARKNRSVVVALSNVGHARRRHAPDRGYTMSMCSKMLLAR